MRYQNPLVTKLVPEIANVPYPVGVRAIRFAVLRHCHRTDKGVIAPLLASVEAQRDEMRWE